MIKGGTNPSGSARAINDNFIFLQTTNNTVKTVMFVAINVCFFAKILVRD